MAGTADSFLDLARALSVRSGPKCWAPGLRDQLGDKVADSVELACQMAVAGRGITFTGLAKALGEEHDFHVRAQQVSHHARRVCSCPKPDVDL